MLSIFGLTFFAVYFILKWRYVVPSLYNKQGANWSVWPYSVAAGGIAIAQLLFGVPRVSQVSAYIQLFFAVYSVGLPRSCTYKACIAAQLLSSIHIFREGTIAAIILTAMVLMFTFKYHHHNRHMLPE